MFGIFFGDNMRDFLTNYLNYDYKSMIVILLV